MEFAPGFGADSDGPEGAEASRSGAYVELSRPRTGRRCAEDGMRKREVILSLTLTEWLAAVQMHPGASSIIGAARRIASDPYRGVGNYDNRAFQPTRMRVQDPAQSRNLGGSALVGEAQENQSAVCRSLAIDSFAEALVVGYQNSALSTGLEDHLVIGQPSIVVENARDVVPSRPQPAGNRRAGALVDQKPHTVPGEAGRKSVSARDRAANSMQARMSSAVRPSYSSTIS